MFTLELKTTNAAFEEGYVTEEVSRILREVAENVEYGDADSHGIIFDINGNSVGTWQFTPNDY